MKKLIIIITAFLLLSPVVATAENLGENRVFFVDSSYDLAKRTSIRAVLLKVSSKAYFYVDQEWWGFTPQNEVYAALSSLGDAFDSKIYPTLTANYGSEWNPGIDKDSRITVLIHPMTKGAGGYFRSNDEYTKLQVPGSNEREMVYLSSEISGNTNAASFLAHEFTHLITFNQKNKIYGAEEDTWLNEARAEYAPTLLGYDNNFSGSYLQNRVQLFSDEPFDPIAEWTGNRSDYGAVNLLTQYLVDYYGKEILIDSLRSAKVGIDSVNYALNKKGASKNFSQIFVDWTIAVLVNDCNFGANYCYLNSNLKNLHVYPKINFLPLSGKSVLSVTETTKDWAGNWFKVIGGKGNINFSFVSNSGSDFIIPYVIQKSNGGYSVNFLSLAKSKGEINISNFGTENLALIILPISQVRTSDFGENEPIRSFTFTVSASGVSTDPAPENKIIPTGFSFSNNLAIGSRTQDVVYLKLILAEQGCVSNLGNTNYFGVQTLAGVRCLQNKYKSQISQTAGYQISSTGFVGVGTRTQLNALLNK